MPPHHHHHRDLRISGSEIARANRTLSAFFEPKIAGAVTSKTKAGKSRANIPILRRSHQQRKAGSTSALERCD